MACSIANANPFPVVATFVAAVAGVIPHPRGGLIIIMEVLSADAAISKRPHIAIIVHNHPMQ